MPKKYEVTQEIVDLFDTYQSAINCRDKAIKSLFFSKRAIEYGKKAIQAKRKAWELVNALYPEETGKLSYSFDDETLEVGRCQAKK